MNYKHYLVTVYQQDFDKMDAMGLRGFEANWDLPRKKTMSFSTVSEGEKAAEQAFHMLNAPADMLSPYERELARSHRAHSLSVGDVVEVEGVQYLCCSYGWQQKKAA